jgi:undecaprenyl-diphosphatase
VSLSLHLGLDRHQAFSFSFILAIPAILGATLLKVTEAGTLQLINFEYLVGMIAATLTGLVSLQILKVVINHATLHYFGIYCLVLSGITFALALNQI